MYPLYNPVIIKLDPKSFNFASFNLICNKKRLIGDPLPDITEALKGPKILVIICMLIYSYAP